jgi:transposase
MFSALMAGARMSDLLWLRLSEALMQRLAPRLTTDKCGETRVGHRRVISGIVYVLRTDCPRRHAPREYGLPKTRYGCYVCSAIKGL